MEPVLALPKPTLRLPVLCGCANNKPSKNEQNNSVWCNNINVAHKVAAAVRVGTMGINNYFGGDITVPFGGFKQSGNGRDKSMHAFDDYTELKTTWIEFD